MPPSSSPKLSFDILDTAKFTTSLTGLQSHYEDIYDQLTHDQFFKLIYVVIGLLVAAIFFSLATAKSNRRTDERKNQ